MSGMGHNSASFGEAPCEEIAGDLGGTPKKLFHYVQLNLADYITGTLGMNPEQEGIYIRFLSRLYDRGSAFPDNDRLMASIMGLDMRRWRRVKRELVSIGKITIRSGGLTNPRFERERLKRAEEIQKQADATHRYWEKKRAEKETSEESRADVGAKFEGSRREVQPIIGKKTNEINESRQHPTSQSRVHILETKEKESPPTPSHVLPARGTKRDPFGLNKTLTDIHRDVWFDAEDRLQVANGFRAELEALVGADRLRSELDRAAEWIGPNTPGTVLKSKVRGRLQGQVAERRDRDERYRMAVAARGNDAKATSDQVRPPNMPEHVWRKVLADRAAARALR